MIFCAVYIDYLSQLQRCGTTGIEELLESIKSTANSLGGSIRLKEHVLTLTFPENTLFSLFQFTDALNGIHGELEAAEKILRGYSVIVEVCGENDDFFSLCQSLHLASTSNNTIVLSQAAQNLLGQYLELPATGDASNDASDVVKVRHATILENIDASTLLLRPSLCRALGNFLGDEKAAQTRLIHVRADSGIRSVRALEDAFAETPDTSPAIASTLLLNLYSSESSQGSFLPFLMRLREEHAALAKETASQEETALLEKCEPAFLYAKRAVFCEKLPHWLSRSCGIYINLILDLVSRNSFHKGKIPWILCDEPEHFSVEALDLISGRITQGNSKAKDGELEIEHYLTVSNGQASSVLRCKNTIILDAGSNQKENRDQNFSKAAGKAEGRTLRFMQEYFRTLAGSEPPRPETIKNLLNILPMEASIYLYGLFLVQNVLDKQSFLLFMSGLGLFESGALVLENMLIRSGFIDPLETTLPLKNISLSVFQDILPATTLKDIKDRFNQFLVLRYHGGAIEPSLDFLARIGERPSEETLSFACIMSTAQRPDKIETESVEFLSASSQCLLSYYSGMCARDQKKAAKALVSSSERIVGPRAQAIRALMHSEFAYAEGSMERAAKSAKEALLAIGRGAPPKLEARTQRMMGLVSLAGERFSEAIDYFGNAQEIAESSRDEYERSCAAYAKAIAEYMTGSLVRSNKSLEIVVRSAYRQCRPDLVAAAAFLQGRIAIELGSYDQAARIFSALSVLAQEYGLQDANERAEIWRGRALAYAGEYLESEKIFSTYPDDAEASIFRAELEILRGTPENALAFVQESLPISPRHFLPPDSINWSSSFSEVEGKCIAFDQADAALADFQTALRLFASGQKMDGDPAPAANLHALTRNPRVAKSNPALAMYSFFCFLMEEHLSEPPIDRQTVLSRAFKALQQRAGKIEDRAQRALFMEKNIWNRRLIEVARTHKFI